MFRSLTRALVLNGKIETTLAKAKALKAYFEKRITLAKRGSLASRRKLNANLGNDRTTVGLIVAIAQGSTKTSGYLRLIPLPARKGDGAKMARLEVIEKPKEKEEVKTKVKVEKKKVKNENLSTKTKRNK